MTAATVTPLTIGDDPSLHGLTVRVVNVTPQQAQTWLANNGHHRDVKPKNVDKFAKRMDDDTWLLNGKTIVLDRNGRLIGGQHRLHACIKSGRNFLTLVVYGVDPAVLEQEKQTD